VSDLPELPKCLSSLDMHTMELHNVESKLYKNTHIILEQQEKLLTKDVEIIKVKLKLLAHQKLQAKEKENVNNTKYSTFINEVKNKLSIKGKFGFNPDTGEIHE